MSDEDFKKETIYEIKKLKLKVKGLTIFGIILTIYIVINTCLVNYIIYR